MDSRVEPERLDVVLERLSPSTPQGPAIAPADQEDFVLPLGKPDRPGGGLASKPSLRDDIVDFVMPRISEPAILRYDRSVPLLEYLVSDLLPQLGEGSELHALATTLVSDEIARHRALIGRIYQGLAA